MNLGRMSSKWNSQIQGLLWAQHSQAVEEHINWKEIRRAKIYPVMYALHEQAFPNKQGGGEGSQEAIPNSTPVVLELNITYIMKWWWHHIGTRIFIVERIVVHGWICQLHSLSYWTYNISIIIKGYFIKILKNWNHEEKESVWLGNATL